MRSELKTDLQKAIKEYKRSNCPKLNQKKEILKRFVESKNLSVNPTGINKPRKTKSKPKSKPVLTKTAQPRRSDFMNYPRDEFRNAPRRINTIRRPEPAPSRAVSSRYNTTNLVESRINLQNLPNRGNISM